jgi:uncharacterized protein (TIGR03084 family)
MLSQIADFREEAEALNALLSTLADDDWNRVTLFKSWTINDVVQHLHDGDLRSMAATAGRDSFERDRAAIQALRDSGISRREETRQRLGDLSGQRLRERWYAQMTALCDVLAALPADARLPWFGPDMGVRMFATARQMETWAHGQELFDVLGVPRAPTDRLRNIAEIGVRTYGWTFTNRGAPLPGPGPFVRLDAPSGAVWTWNEVSEDNRVEGQALDFCQVVTQVRNVADTGLRVVGAPARAWMRIAQCFAGPPEEPPALGTRFTAPR